ncbi:MAG: aminoglycoside phosphotransferase family protein [Terracoccus sp.]
MEADAAFATRAREHGVRTPEVVRGVSGDVVVEVGGHPLRVWEWVDLGSRTRRLDPSAVGDLVARLHRCAPASDEPVGSWFAAGFGQESWRALHEQVAAHGAPFAEALGRLLPDFVAVESVIEPHRSPILCHRDLWADNVLPDETGRPWVVDFENLGPADPSQELAMVLFEFGDGDPSRARDLHGAYVEAGGPGRVTRRGHFTMLVAAQAHIGQLACARWVGAVEDEPRRALLADSFDEIVQDPVTLGRIDGILAALG